MTTTREPVNLPWNGQVAFVRGVRGGLPVFGWREAPPEVGTKRQLRALGLSIRNLDPVALLEFGHRKPYRRKEVAELYLIAEARPVLPMTEAEWRAHDSMMRARRTCQTCKQVVDHCVRGPRRQCSTCYDFEGIAA